MRSLSTRVEQRAAPRAVRRRGPRAWLLLEVMVGGVMASVLLAELMVSVGWASDRSAYVGRKVTAKMLAEQKIEEARGTIYGSLITGTTTETVTLQGTYTRIVNITDGSVSTGVSGTAILNYKEVRVTVEFGTNPVRTVTTATRVYQGV